MDDDLTPAEREALDNLLPADQRTGDLAVDLAAAARESMRRRVDNSRWGGAVLAALYRERRSWRQVEDETGIPYKTAWRWATPPEGTEDASG